MATLMLRLVQIFTKLLSSDFIRNRLACQDSQRIVNHGVYHHSTGFDSVGADMGGDDNVRKAKERMVPAQKRPIRG